MTARRGVSITVFALLALLLALFVFTRRSAGDGASSTVELQDGRTLSGLLIRVDDGDYILQSPTLAVMMRSSDIRKVNDSEMGGPEALSVPRIRVVQETFEDVRPDGSVLARHTMRWRNTGDEIISQTNWGLAAHEVADLERYVVLDGYGNEIPYRVEDDPKIHGKRLFLDFPRPVLPGEELHLTSVIEERDRITASGDTSLYRIEGDYPDDRLVTRSILLPAGARVISVEPEPLQQLTSGGRILVIWRRYFRVSERFPWQVRYVL